VGNLVSAMTNRAHADDFTTLSADNSAGIAAIIYCALGKDSINFGFIEGLIRLNRPPAEIAGWRIGPHFGFRQHGAPVNSSLFGNQSH
jgi:hypothetical protein